MINQDLLDVGFKEIPHFTIGNTVIFDLGRNRQLSASCVGTPNETLWLSQIDDNNPKEITDIICLHNFDYDGEYELRNDEDIKKAMFEYNGWDLNDEDHQILFDNLSKIEIELILEENYRKICITERIEYQNAFLTEKACKEHIRLNHYNYNNPIDYVSHAFRNPELETVINFIKSLTIN